MGSEESRGSLQMKRRLSGITFVISTALEEAEEISAPMELDEEISQKIDLMLDQFPKPPTQRVIPTIVPGSQPGRRGRSNSHASSSEAHKTIWSQSLKGLTFGMFSNSNK
ncbi:hypothetical protein EON64_18210 [archaeon]|nr:MAG: hypothetical protein EON64_18210 [archaeon]